MLAGRTIMMIGCAGILFVVAACDPGGSPEQPPDSGAPMPGEVADLALTATRMEQNDLGVWEARFDHGIVMAYIPAGTFKMGSEAGLEDEVPVHEVYLDGYWLSTYMITVGQFREFIEATGYVTDAERGYGSWQYVGSGTEGGDGWEPVLDGRWNNTYFEQSDDHPVGSVSWTDANEFCRWLSGEIGVDFQLPTEAQWEKGARGIDERIYPWGNEPPNGSRANYADANFFNKYGDARPADPEIDDGHTETSPVGAFPAGRSPYGLLDMAGNLGEWVYDWYDPDFYSRSPRQNPSGPEDALDDGGEPRIDRVNRGGSWVDRSGHLSPEHGHNLRSAARTGDEYFSSDDHMGFRVAIDPGREPEFARHKPATRGLRRILYESVVDGDSEVFVINEDGSAAANLTNRSGYDGMPSWSADGSEIVFVSDRGEAGGSSGQASGGSRGDVFIMNADGTNVRRITTDGAGYAFPKLSPDGTRIAFDAGRESDNAQVYVMDADGGNVRRVTHNDVDEGYVSWTPDSRSLVFDTFRDGPPEIYRIDVDGGNPTRLTHFGAHIGDPRLSPDGSKLAFESGMDGDSEIYMTNAEGTEPTRLTWDPADDRAPAISHDGRRVAFCSDRGGEREAFELFVMNADGTGLLKITDTRSSNLYPTFEPPKQQED